MIIVASTEDAMIVMLTLYKPCDCPNKNEYKNDASISPNGLATHRHVRQVRTRNTNMTAKTPMDTTARSAQA